MKATSQPQISKNHKTAEHDRQQEYLDELPDDFEFPLFNALTALKSQRKSGYKNTAAAAREILDNGIEAGANRVHVAIESQKIEINNRSRTIVKAVAFIDNGPGMLPMMARYALTWGGGTHFESHDFIGKFGFGLPNASINQTKRTEVYTRFPGQETITKVVLDIDTFSRNGVQVIPAPKQVTALPAFVASYLKNRNWDFTQGTVVVWQSPDQLSYRTPANLKEHLLEDFGVAYRYLLNRFELVIDGTPVKPIDPLFLTPGFELYLPPNEGGAQLVEQGVVPVVFYELASGEMRMKRAKDFHEKLEDDVVVNKIDSSISFKVGRFPYGFAVGGNKVDKEAFRRFEIRKARRGMSFVRAGREIEVVDAFPRLARDVSSGLGNWPLLQSYAYHWGIEVQFSPELDDAFGITNDKQRVRPSEDFWRILEAEEIDDLLRRENNYQEKIREKARFVALVPRRMPSFSELAAQDADRVLNQLHRIPSYSLEEAKSNFESSVEAAAKEEGIPREEARKRQALLVSKRPYKIDFFDNEYGPAWEPIWNARQIVVKINKSHEFYKEVYAPLLEDEHAFARYGIELLLMTLSRSELRQEEKQKAQWFYHLRTRDWSDFLKASISNLSARTDSGDEPE
jgi:hypothetical protein